MFGYYGDFMSVIDKVINIPKQKLLFIHIAKTAGTSVNEFFANYFGLDQMLPNLQENPMWINNPGRLFQDLKIRFISGHISYAEFKEKVDISDFLVVTCMRNPLAHIASHLLHFRILAEEKNRELFEVSSDEMKLVILRLAKLDFSSSEAIKHYLKNLTDQELLLFDNTQTRYLTNNFPLNATGQRIGFKEVTPALRNLKKIDVVGDSCDIESFLTAVSVRMGWPAPEDAPKVNVNNEKYGMDINNPAMVNALWPFIRYDMALYSQRTQFLCTSNSLMCQF